jgi:hypothetical protein
MKSVQRVEKVFLIIALSAALAMVQLSGVRADTAPADPLNPKTPVSVAADALPTVQIDGVAWTQRVIGNTVYVGGGFTSARPAGAPAGQNTTARANLLAYEITTGKLITSWNVATNGPVFSIAASPDQTILYLGGSFTRVNGVIRNRIAAVNRATGKLIDTFQPKPDATVRAIVATSKTVYFGGLLGAVSGVTRPRLAAVQASDGKLLSWAPVAAGGSVQAMALSPAGDKLVVSGSFTTMNGSSNPGYGLAALNPSTAANLSFPANTLVRNGGVNAAITALSSDGDSLYASGYLYGDGGNFEGVTRIN